MTGFFAFRKKNLFLQSEGLRVGGRRHLRDRHALLFEKLVSIFTF